MLKRIFILYIALFLFVAPVKAFWIWTPKDQTWTNPKWSAKNTPKAQFDFAKEILDSGDYKTALVEFKKLLQHFTESFEAADGQFYMGECLEKLDKPYDAYLAYQKVIDKYPFSDKMDEILKRQLKIAEVLTDMKYKILGLPLTGQYYAIEVYRKIIDNAPYNELAPVSQYRIGLILKSVENFDEAKKEFEKVTNSYPESEWAEAAKYQIAECASMGSLRSDYDQKLSQEAKDRFNDFVRKYPEADLSSEAKAAIADLTDREAKKEFEVAQFYEKQESYGSAKIYYKSVIRKYPNSQWAQKAKEQLRLLEEEGNK